MILTELRGPNPYYPFAQQNEWEFLAWRRRFVEGASSLLEIGSCYGHTLRMQAARMKAGSRIVSVDLCRGVCALEGVDTGMYLKDTINQLRYDGYDAHLIEGDSHNHAIAKYAKSLGPYDICFIDGDHSYDGVKQDFLTYASMAKIMAFHDIFYEKDCGVPRFWQEEIKRGYPTIEIRAPGSRFGIGVLFP